MKTGIKILETYFGEFWPGVWALEQIIRKHYPNFAGNEENLDEFYRAIIAREERDGFWENFWSALDRSEEAAATYVAKFYPKIKPPEERLFFCWFLKLREHLRA